MELKISKSEIFSEVEKRTSLEGFINSEQFDKAWANESRGELLDSYWVGGYTAIVQLLKRYLSSGSVSYSLNTFNKDEVLTISVEFPKRYDSKLDGSVLTDIKMILACNILSGWLAVVMPEVAPKYEEEAKGYSEDLRVKLLYRKAPDREMFWVKEDNEVFEQGWDGCFACGRDHENIVFS